MPVDKSMTIIEKATTTTQSWRIHGTDSQVVEIALAPGESAMCEPGSMCYTSNTVQVKMSATSMFGSAMTSESMLKPKYTNTGNEPGFVAFTPNMPANIVALDLNQYKEGFFVKQGMYFAQTGGGDAVRIQAGVNPAKSCAACCCTGFSLIMQTIEPGPTPGFAFLAASGTILEKELAAGEVIIVSTGCVVGFSKNITLSVRSNGGCCVCCFSGEGLFSTTLEGPGKVMLQSMPIDKIRALFPAANLQNGTDMSKAGDA
jgi:uncharacterized protein (AIM24 family)